MSKDATCWRRRKTEGCLLHRARRPGRILRLCHIGIQTQRIQKRSLCNPLKMRRINIRKRWSFSKVCTKNLHLTIKSKIKKVRYWSQELLRTTIGQSSRVTGRDSNHISNNISTSSDHWTLLRWVQISRCHRHSHRSYLRHFQCHKMFRKEIPLGKIKGSPYSWRIIIGQGIATWASAMNSRWLSMVRLTVHPRGEGYQIGIMTYPLLGSCHQKTITCHKIPYINRCKGSGNWTIKNSSLLAVGILDTNNLMRIYINRIIR